MLVIAVFPHSEWRNVNTITSPINDYTIKSPVQQWDKAVFPPHGFISQWCSGCKHNYFDYSTAWRHMTNFLVLRRWDQQMKFRVKVRHLRHARWVRTGIVRIVSILLLNKKFCWVNSELSSPGSLCYLHRCSADFALWVYVCVWRSSAEETLQKCNKLQPKC